jgi:hypothetical protein
VRPLMRSTAPRCFASPNLKYAWAPATRGGAGPFYGPNTPTAVFNAVQVANSTDKL